MAYRIDFNGNREEAYENPMRDAVEMEYGVSAMSNVLTKQVNGNHYKNLGIQPVEYIQSNDLDFFQGSVIKYVTRHKDKGGAADIRKAIHFCEMIIELQYESNKSGLLERAEQED